MKPKTILLFIYLLTFSLIKTGKAQTTGEYPPYTKWYQDPLGLKPLELSTAFGFIWGASAVAASLIFTKNPASRERVFLYQEAGLGYGYKPPYTGAFQNEMGAAYRIREWMSVGIGWDAFHFSDQTNNTWSFGIRPFARWYPYKSKRAALFFEYGAGLSYSLQRFPLTGTGWGADTARTGTRFNLVSKYGIGAEFYFNGRLSLQAGIRHFHLSNGNLAGIERNPSHDSNGLFCGLLFTLSKTVITGL